MAELTIGIGMSHGPMVVSEVDTWVQIAELDVDSKLLVDTTGKPVTFHELEQANGDRFKEHAARENLERQCKLIKVSLARLRSDFEAAGIDAVVVIGDDQFELFDYDNLPMLGVFYGPELVTCTTGRKGRYGAKIGGLDDVHRGYGMDERRRWPGHEPLARHMISSLIGDRFDVAALKEVDRDSTVGVGHSYGVVAMQLMGEDKTPMIPVLVNTYWPPNQMPAARCYDFGVRLREAIESYEEDLKVAVVASGGLSHFVTDEDLDHQTLEALRSGNAKNLLDLPEHLLNSGNSEIRNWISLAAAFEGKAPAWDDYIPVYRTPAGTGCGMAFARWS